MAYKFEIQDTRSGQYMALFGYLTEPLVWSEEYTSKQNAINAANIVKNNAHLAICVDLTVGDIGSGYRFEVFRTSDAQYMVRFVSSNGQIVVVSERYTAKHNALNCIKSVQENARFAPIYDQTNSRAA